MCKVCEDEAERHARALLREADAIDTRGDGLCHDACCADENGGYDEDDEPVEPHLIESQAEIDGYPPFPFPNLHATPTPDGWKVERELFCDSTGRGSPSEPALTVEQLKAGLRPGFAYAITGEGQFQVYVTEYKRSEIRP